MDSTVADEEAKHGREPAISWIYANSGCPRLSMCEGPSEVWHQSVVGEGSFVRCKPCRKHGRRCSSVWAIGTEQIAVSIALILHHRLPGIFLGPNAAQL